VSERSEQDARGAAVETSGADEQPEPTAAGPLTGIRILDLSAVVSGPMASMVLADQGADVIKVEPPGWGDGIRFLGASNNGVGAMFSTINRNKRSIAVNWKHPEGVAIMRQLVKGADVLLQNYRPGKLDRAGLGFDDLHSLNPDLIYASINGVGETGPHAGQKVYDYVIQGLSGATDTWMNGQRAMFRTIVYDKVTAMTAAQGITAALLARERGSGGQHIRLSMLDAGLQFNWPDLMWNYTFDDPRAQLSGDTSTYSTEELVELFARNDMPIGRANLRAEVEHDPQVKATDALVRYEHPRGGALRQPRPSVRFEKTPASIRRPSPEVGEHTVEVLSELGLDIEAMRELARKGVIA
jgi:crotonobetainyl-CoA:carnitine CoA-transferase CaiB-like acyl-CoA transferase